METCSGNLETCTFVYYMYMISKKYFFKTDIYNFFSY